MSITRVGVVGCGTMGAGLAELCARAGLDVRVAVSSAASAEAGRARIARSLDKAVTRGKLDAPAAGRALAAVTFTADLAELADRELVIESVPEDAGLKQRIFAELDAAVTAIRARSSPRTRRHCGSPSSPRTPGARRGWSGCTSSTRCTCSRWSRWSRPRRPRSPTRPRRSPPRCSANR